MSKQVLTLSSLILFYGRCKQWRKSVNYWGGWNRAIKSCTYIEKCIVACRRVARIWKKVQTTLTRIFIVLKSESHDLSENCDGISRKYIRYFSPKTGGLQKKKKRSSSKLSQILQPILEILTFFLPKIRWSPNKKKKKKKRSSLKLSQILRPKFYDFSRKR